ncbi:MAG: type II secretion system protein GspG [Planctomycetaceae bacterium]
MNTRRPAFPPSKRRSGFTLLELLIVLGIIVALVAMVLPNLLGRDKEAKIQTTKITIRNVESALKQKAVHNDSEFPQGGQEVIEELATVSQDSRGRERAPYLDEVPIDAWGERLFYSYDPGADLIKPKIWSSGPDRKDDNGSNDDVNNWDSEVQQK